MKKVLLLDIDCELLKITELLDDYKKSPSPHLFVDLFQRIQQIKEQLVQYQVELEAVLLKSKEATSTLVAIENSLAEKLTPKTVVPQKTEAVATSPVLGEHIRTSTDLRRAISLNDAFRFTRELFDGDSDLMNRVIEQISAMSALDTAIAFLSSKVNVNEGNETMIDFMELLKQHFKSV